MYICVSVYVIFKKERNKRKKGRKVGRKNEWKVRCLTFFVVKKIKWKWKKERKKERTNHVIFGLQHRKRKEKKADKLLGKQADVTTEQFLQFLSSSAWLCIFWIYIDSNKEERGRERNWESLQFINDTDNLIFQIILSLLHESCCFYYNNIRDTFHLLIYSFYILISFLSGCLMSRVFADGPEDRGSIPGRVISKTH